jgi:DNA phosphorothioation-dependent restriction protein DptG
MRSLRKLFVVGVVASLLGMPSFAYSQQIIFTLCRWYNAEKNCYRCSDYFSVRSEEQAKRKCKGGTPYYFPSVFALQSWMIANCTCGEDEE